MYTECPHCSAIFTLPAELTATKVRCGECNTVFNTNKTKAELIPASTSSDVEHAKQKPELDIPPPPPAPELDLATMDLSEIEKIDAEINDSLDAEIEKMVGESSTLSKQQAQELEDEFLYEAKSTKSLGDTLKLPVLDDMEYTDHSDAARRNDMAATLDERDGSDNLLGDDIFDEFISSQEIIDPKIVDSNIDDPSGITAKSSGQKISDHIDVLPDLDADIKPPREATKITPISDKLAATADDMFIQEAPPNSVFKDLNPSLDSSEEIALPDLQELPARKPDVNQIVEELRDAATNDDVLKGQPFGVEEQHALKLDTQTELPGLEQSTSASIDTPKAQQIDGIDNLINLEEFDLENTALQPRPSKREFVYEYRKLIAFFIFFTLLCLVLGGQYIRHNREEFKHYAGTRPVADLICRFTGCEITPPRESEKIEIVEHSIFPHKLAENALTVKAKVINNAEKSQPFPVLQVNFYNLTGQKIATRRFGPNEYLKKLPRRNGLMPRKEAVYFEFDIADPGRDGVSFDLIIR